MVTARTIQRLRRLLLAAQFVGLAGVLFVGSRLYRAPVDPGSLAVIASDAQTGSPTTADSPEDLHPLDWYEPIWQRDLRQPPIPPVIQNTPAPTPRPDPPQLPTLVATFVERGTGWAHLITANGSPRVLRVHETLGDFVLAAVEPSRAALQFGEDVYWLEVPMAGNVIKEQP